MFPHKTSYCQRSIHFAENQQNPCLICNAPLYSVRRSSSMPCSGAVSLTVKSWFCLLCKKVALGLDAFIINEMYYSNQITFQPKNTNFCFENNKAPWGFLGYNGHYDLNIIVSTDLLTTIIILYL